MSFKCLGLQLVVEASFLPVSSYKRILDEIRLYLLANEVEKLLSHCCLSYPQCLAQGHSGRAAVAVIKISIPSSWLNDIPCCPEHHNRTALYTQQEHNFLSDSIFFSCRHKSRHFCVSPVFLQIHFFPILCTLHK